MMTETKYDAFIESSEDSLEYWTDTAITDFTEEISRLMHEQNVSKTELARRIGHSQAYVTKVLRGNVNFTLATMTKLARALGTVVRVHLAPEAVVVEWSDRKPDDVYTITFPRGSEIELSTAPHTGSTADISWDQIVYASDHWEDNANAA